MASRTCPQGHAVAAGLPMCPECGHLMEVMDGPEPAAATPASPPLRLEFAGIGPVDLHAHGEQVLLGRGPQSPHASLFEPFVRVSRVHATIGVDADGRAWIRDEGSTNGTFHNGSRLFPTREVQLRDGDSVRLSEHLPATVHLGRGDRPTPDGEAG